jgi:hypothetical protein
MAKTTVSMSLIDSDARPVGKAVYVNPDQLSVELESAEGARRLAEFLRQFADFVEGQASNPASLDTWGRS